MLASFHAYGTELTSQALLISWCSLLNRLSPPCFHTSAGIPTPPGALPSFRQVIALAISAMVGISSRLVLVMRCVMLSRASWSMSPGTLSSFWKWSLHLATILDFRWTGPFFLGPHTSFCPLSFLSAVLCSSYAILSNQSCFSARVRFCSSLQASLYAAVVELVLLVCNTLWWVWSGRWGRTSTGVFCLACQYMFWLCCI